MIETIAHMILMGAAGLILAAFIDTGLKLYNAWKELED